MKMAIMIAKGLGLAIGLIVFALIIGFAYLWINEYKPAPVEPVEIGGQASATLSLSAPLSLLTFNLGYCGLSADTDCYFDGGEMVRPPSKEIVERNLNGILDLLKAQSADIVLLQEVDRDSKRGYGVNSVAAVTEALAGTNTFANNFLCKYVPYPWPPVGKVDSGLLTIAPYEVTSAQRHALPTPFSWPTRVCQLKRGLLVQRMPLTGSDKELVLINLHLEAYDDGEGKLAQTKILVDLMTSEYEKGNYCMAGGDFNQTFPTVDNSKYPIVHDDFFVPGQLDSNLLPADWTFAADGQTPTSRLNNQVYDPQSPDTQHHVIDGFILSPNVTLQSVKTIDAGFEYTDHNPVRLEVTFKQ